MGSDTRSRVLIYDPLIGGHHAEYVAHLIRARPRVAPEVCLDVAIRPELIDSSPELSELVETAGPSVRVYSVPPLKQSSLLRSSIEQGRIFDRLIRDLRPAHALAMYVDRIQINLAIGLRFPFPVKVSGILFRPTFHEQQGPARLSGRLQTMRKEAILGAAVRNPHLHQLFCLDPDAARAGSERWPSAGFQTLPDPVDSGAERPWAHADSLKRDRKNALVFGVLDQRKGIKPLFRAVECMSEFHAAQLRIVLVGQVPPEASWVKEEVDRIAATSRVEVTLIPHRVPDAEVQSMIRSMDLMLLLYQREHVGSSGVLIRSAAAHIPVLATDRGLVGRYVRHHRLGVTANAEDAADIASALTSWIDGQDLGFDATSAGEFASRHTPDAFAETILKSMSA